MKESQPTLMSLFGMTSTRQMRSVQRARARDGYLSRSSSTGAAKSAAPTVAALVHKPNNSRASSPAKQDEMTLPGENRWYALTALDRCPTCGSAPTLDVEWHWHKGVVRIPSYRVACKCKRDFPELPSSQDAIHHWKLSLKLASL